MKRSPVKRKLPPSIPQETRLAVWDRAGAKCEWCSTTYRGDRLQLAHLEHRKLGGRHGIMAKAIHDSRNVALLCLKCHNILDRRAWNPEVREKMMTFLKDKLDWAGWQKEYEVRE